MVPEAFFAGGPGSVEKVSTVLGRGRDAERVVGCLGERLREKALHLEQPVEKGGQE